jgi:hypothetical protein
MVSVVGVSSKAAQRLVNSKTEEKYLKKRPIVRRIVRSLQTGYNFIRTVLNRNKHLNNDQPHKENEEDDDSYYGTYATILWNGNELGNTKVASEYYRNGVGLVQWDEEYFFLELPSNYKVLKMNLEVQKGS